jgi:beta-1,4-mannosyl-glycoprotein beta-1,4-N-acetylglucosaminyltransferase
MANLLRRPRLVFVFLVVLVLSLFIVYQGVQNLYQIRNLLSYSTRPLWDTKEGPKQVIPHYYAEGMKMDQHACKLHEWEKRASDSVQVFDAILMSSELDLLEIRLNELDAVVDKFFILESNATFTGLAKETYFANNQTRFAKFKSKIIYHLYVFYIAAGNSTL